MHILVTRAAGYIGGRMIDSLCQHEWVESVIGSDINESEFKHEKYRFIQHDIRQPMDSEQIGIDIEAIVHTAWILPPIHDKGKMEDVNKGGTRHILDFAVKSGAKQILYTSSTTAYGFHPDNANPITEDSPLRGNDDFTYAKNKKEVEAVMADFTVAHPEIAVTILRPCFVVGPGFKNPLSEHLKKKLVLLPAGSLPWQFVHEDDLIKVMMSTLKERIAGVFNVTGEGTITFSEMVKMLGNIRIPLPWPIIYPLNNLSWF